MATNSSCQPDSVALTPAEECSQASLGNAPAVLTLIQRHSQLVIALLEVQASLGADRLRLEMLFATARFRRLVGAAGDGQDLTADIFQCLPPADQRHMQRRFRRYLLAAILYQRYGLPDLIDPRLLTEPMLVTLAGTETASPLQVELRLQLAAEADQGPIALTVSDLDPQLLQALDACWPEGMPTKQQVMAQLLASETPLLRLLEQLQPGTYAATGRFLLEGMEITERETTQSLMQLLVSRESGLEPQRFGRANRLMQQLFRADGSCLLSAENDRATLFTQLDQPEWQSHTYGVQSLHESVFFQAAMGGEVMNIPDLRPLQQRPHWTACEQTLLEMGVRSLLVLPLMMKAPALGESGRGLLALVGITSHTPYAFNQADSDQARALIPALTAAFRHTVQDRFTSIHPAVRWRFEQEAERRSWGFSPTPIVFEDVYPLYGISDIRGSSEERNGAIQADLIEQFELALAVMQAVCQGLPNAFARQFRQDLEESLTQLRLGVTVDAEVTLLRYLQDECEAHFPIFSQVSSEAAAAIAAYQAALDPEQGCVYRARAEYDATINQINSCLRHTWERWQQKLQGITPHYCDTEATDGIDHMIYAGRSIDCQFSAFHLRSLRYEQLRAVCDCARTAFELKASHATALEVTHLVLVQATTVDIIHDEHTERLFDVRGTRDTRYEIVKKRIDKACDAQTRDRITQPGMLTVVYSTEAEGQEYRQYLRYLQREGIVGASLDQGLVEPLQGVNGLKFMRVPVLPALASTPAVPAGSGQD